MIKYQYYNKFRLPISLNPLDYGKLILKIEKLNLFIIQINRDNLVIINQNNDFNHVKFFKWGDFKFEYKDFKINDNGFTRSIDNKQFTFKNNELITTLITSIIKINKLIINLFLVYIICFIIFPENSADLTNIALSSANIIKLRKVKSKYNWNEVQFNINNKIFTKALFEKIFSQFWKTIENKFSEDNHMFILLKIKYYNSDFSTIGKLQRINIKDFSWYIDFVLENMKFKSEYYNETEIESIIFSYGFKKGKIENKDNSNINVNYQNYKNNNLPISMNPIDFGRIIIKNKSDTGIIYIIQNKDLTIEFNQLEKYNKVEFFKSGISLTKFTDIFINKNSFLREIDNKKFWFDNGKQVLFTSEIKTKFISKTVKAKSLTNNFITLDIETFIQENTLIPYLICFYDGKVFKSFGLWDYQTVEMMILDCLKSMLIRKYNRQKVYVHNLAKFDIIFLLKYLVKIASVKPIIHNGRIISIILNFGKNLEYQIEFKDSYLMLLNSLDSLSDSFKVDNAKSVFPHLFVNKDNLNYIGEVPNMKYFYKIDKDIYKNYKTSFNSLWVLKDEALKYCKLDCLSLYQVLIKFNSMIFELFNKNIHNYPTLPSLAFAIFRSNFITENTIPQLSGKIAKDIRLGYTGGAVDVYIPFNKKGIKIKGLDVNALYPKQMCDKLMPIGLPTYFEGDIRQIDKNAFGFFYCNIIAPDNIKHPIIQTHVKINNMTRTIAPIGTWTDMLFSPEMDNAMKYGYKFNILWGYTFNKQIIFKEYVEFLHNLRNKYPRTNPMNYIGKILLNSLYGRFGMDDNFSNIEIIHKDYYADFENKYLDQIVEKIDLGKYIIVFYKTEINVKDNRTTHNVSIATAAAITSYSRIYMTMFKNNPKINLYYTDTDSIYTDSDIDSIFIDEKSLGKLKLENSSKKAIFLSPKVYCLETETGEFIHKVKGLKHKVELTFKGLLELPKVDINKVNSIIDEVRSCLTDVF
jgi:hypothetical protein